MKYEIYVNQEGNKRVRFLDCKRKSGKCIDYCVNIDEEEREYFPIPNMKNTEELYLFNDRVQDAIECIRQGDGDVLSVNKTGCALFGGNRVYRFVNREYGEELRYKTIEGWKDTVFGYGLKFGYKNSFSGGLLLNTKNKRFFGQEGEEKLTFKTKEEAETYKNNILTTVNRLKDRLNILELNNEAKAEKFISKCFKKYGIEVDLLCDGKDECYLDIVQVVIK